MNDDKHIPDRRLTAAEIRNLLFASGLVRDVTEPGHGREITGTRVPDKDDAIQPQN